MEVVLARARAAVAGDPVEAARGVVRLQALEHAIQLVTVSVEDPGAVDRDDQVPTRPGAVRGGLVTGEVDRQLTRFAVNRARPLSAEFVKSLMSF